MVRDVIAELPMSHQAVVVLYLENLSLEEVAGGGIPVGTVKSVHMRVAFTRCPAQRQLYPRWRMSSREFDGMDDLVQQALYPLWKPDRRAGVAG